MRIGALEFTHEVPLVLAPLAGYSDAAHRMVCREVGADLTVSEMTSADALVLTRRSSKGFRKTMSLLAAEDADHPFSAQLFGKNSEHLAEACRIAAAEARIELIDLNAGCPVRKVVNSGHGVALMRDPLALGRIIAAMRAATDLPVTVKLRAGAEEVNVVECARICAAEGADAITVHPRTRAQMFTGLSDWSLIAAVKDAVGIPVIGNGDINVVHDAVGMVGQTGCDAVMIGRAAVSRPWIFTQARAALAGRPVPPTPDGEAKLALLRRHVDLLVKHNGEARASREIRKFALYMVRGMRGAAAARREIATAPTIPLMFEQVALILTPAKEADSETST